MEWGLLGEKADSKAGTCKPESVPKHKNDEGM